MKVNNTILMIFPLNLNFHMMLSKKQKMPLN